MSKQDNESTKSVHLRLKKDFLDEIDAFTEEFYFTNRTDAMRYLMVLGLKYQQTANDLINKRTKD